MESKAAYTYYAAFIPGLQDVVAEVIKERLTDVTLRKLLDGAVIFETETSYDKLNFFCFNNIFAVISIIEHRECHGTLVPAASAASALETHINSVINKSLTREAAGIISSNSKKIQSFRIAVSRENTPAAIDEKLRAAAEGYISRLSGLKVNRSSPDAEFWFLFRRVESPPNFSVFMKRLTLRPSWEKSLHSGELPPPLAWTLCRLAHLKYGDTVLDPFCGYGSIPDAALKHFHIAKFIACDNNGEAAAYTAARFKKRKEGEFVLHKADFLSLPALITEKSIDVVITDPPWGLYREIQDERFYERMFGVFAKLIKDGGRVIVLCANKEELLGAVPACFKLQGSIPILLSGKKAAIFQFVKKGTDTC
ncbi:MAG: methyltransferase domain-containing protein [Treponema sp.]|jgi:tRNA G10  N-methylase Trm11|nr:methyltransferase domain-containing protein [Treponema sp.]